MSDPRLHKLADVLVTYCAPVKRGDLVTIVGEPGCMAAVEAIFEAVLRAGGYPSFHTRSERLQEILLRHGSDEQIRHVSPFEAHRLATCDVLIVLKYETKHLGGSDPKKIAMMQAARCEILAASMQRMAEGKMRYVLTEIPSDAAAQDANMSLADYAQWVYRAGFLHLPDPVAAWRKLREQHEKAIECLQSRRLLRIQAPASNGAAGARKHDGTDLTVDISGRTWMNCAGGENFPDGEVCTGPRTADGIVNFNLPAIFSSREIDGIRLKLRAGRVVEATADRNEELLIALLDQDDGARGIAEIGMGTNYQIEEFTKNAFFDEKMGGAFKVALGAAYPQTGATNKSGLHWDIVGDLRGGGTIHADGELIHRDGNFISAGWPQSRSL